jgi:hypothetical protein
VLNRADGWDRDEWLAIIRSRCPTASEEELEQAWDEFITLKHQILDAGQTTLQ